MMEETIRLESVGRLACTLQIPMQRLRWVAQGLGISPSMSLNGTDYFDEVASEKIARYVAEHTKGRKRRSARLRLALDK